MLQIFLAYGGLRAELQKCIVLAYGCHGSAVNKIQVIEPTHPDAELHIFATVNFHAFI